MGDMMVVLESGTVGKLLFGVAPVIGLPGTVEIYDENGKRITEVGIVSEIV